MTSISEWRSVRFPPTHSILGSAKVQASMETTEPDLSKKSIFHLCTELRFWLQLASSPLQQPSCQAQFLSPQDFCSHVAVTAVDNQNIPPACSALSNSWMVLIGMLPAVSMDCTDPVQNALGCQPLIYKVIQCGLTLHGHPICNTEGQRMVKSCFLPTKRT